MSNRSKILLGGVAALFCLSTTGLAGSCNDSTRLLAKRAVLVNDSPDPVKCSYSGQAFYGSSGSIIPAGYTQSAFIGCYTGTEYFTCGGIKQNVKDCSYYYDTNTKSVIFGSIVYQCKFKKDGSTVTWESDS